VKARPSSPKYVRAAELVRARIADGTLRPGESAPSAAALGRTTGFSVLTCRKALWTLVNEGVLVPGRSRNGRPRVPGPASTSAEQTLADTEHALSASLAARRRALGLTQPQLAAAIDMSVTTVGHAETGRLWQSRHFWEQADKALDADGELLRLHDACQAAGVLSSTADAVVGDPIVTEIVSSVVTVTCITITWSDGTITTIDPPNSASACQAGDNRGSWDVPRRFVASVNVPPDLRSLGTYEQS
jgi:DNA-binding transcriptional regulator YhcF (GntR family)